MVFTFVNFLQLLGSVGLFIFGMKVMSDGIQKSAGFRFREVINAMTANKYYGLLTGMFATFLVQSSSVTTVMVVSLANGGILSLTQSIGVILGANIGTTITAWMLTIVQFGSLDSSVFSLTLIFVGVILLFNNKERIQSYGEVTIGIALLFLGIKFMQLYAPDLQSNPQLLEFLKSYEFENVAYFQRLGAILLFVLIGAIVAVIVQSSTAAIAITLVMTAKGWIPLPYAMAIVLGENIGTTATANIAALIGNIQAKRAAFAHFTLNFLGVIWAVLLFDVLLRITVAATVQFGGENPIIHTASIPLALSIFHSIFNIVNVAIFLGAIPLLAKIATRVFPSENQPLSTDLIPGMFNTAQVSAPMMSIIRVKKEVHSMVKLSQRTFQYLPKMLMEGELNMAKVYLDKVQRLEKTSDEMEINILRFLSKVSENKLDSRLSEEIRALMSSVNYLERCCDLMVKSALNMHTQKERKAYFTPEQRNNILELMQEVEGGLEMLEEAWLLDKVDWKLAQEKEDAINNMYRGLRKDYLKKIEKGKFTIQSGLFYMDLLSELERMGDHIYSICDNMANLR